MKNVAFDDLSGRLVQAYGNTYAYPTKPQTTADTAPKQATYTVNAIQS